MGFLGLNSKNVGKSRKRVKMTKKKTQNTFGFVFFCIFFRKKCLCSATLLFNYKTMRNVASNYLRPRLPSFFFVYGFFMEGVKFTLDHFYINNDIYIL
jgi:hypothetical protein